MVVIISSRRQVVAPVTPRWGLSTIGDVDASGSSPPENPPGKIIIKAILLRGKLKIEKIYIHITSNILVLIT